MKPIKATRPPIYLLTILTAILLYAASALSSDKAPYSLKSPEDTIKTFYSAYRTCNFNLIKKAVVGTDGVIFQENFKKDSFRFLSYKIINKKIVTNEDRWHIKGDVDIFVTELWKDNTETKMSFILRKYDKEWLIINWATVNEAEEPPDINELSKQVEDMIKYD